MFSESIKGTLGLGIFFLLPALLKLGSKDSHPSEILHWGMCFPGGEFV